MHLDLWRLWRWPSKSRVVHRQGTPPSLNALVPCCMQADLSQISEDNTMGRFSWMHPCINSCFVCGQNSVWIKDRGNKTESVALFHPIHEFCFILWRLGDFFFGQFQKLSVQKLTYLCKDSDDSYRRYILSVNYCSDYSVIIGFSTIGTEYRSCLMVLHNVRSADGLVVAVYSFGVLRFAIWKHLHRRQIHALACKNV